MADERDYDMLGDGALLDRVGMIDAAVRGFDCAAPGEACVALSRDADANGVRATFTAIEQVAGWVGRVMRIDFDDPEGLHALLGGIAEIEGLLASCRRVLNDRQAQLEYEAGENG